MYELGPYSLEMYRVSENELPTSRLSKVIAWQTDRQTDTTEIIYRAASQVANNVINEWNMKRSIKISWQVSVQQCYSVRAVLAESNVKLSRVGGVRSVDTLSSHDKRAGIGGMQLDTQLEELRNLQVT